MNVTQTLPQGQTRMAVSPQDRVRASIVASVVREVAERLLQADKANPGYALADLRDDDERAVYIAAALDVFAPVARTDRIHQINALRARGFAEAEHERHGGPAGAAGCCFLCGQRIDPMQAHTIRLSPISIAEVHGDCAAKDARCEVVSSFAFRFVGGSR